MAAGKKSFVLYADVVHSVEILTDEQAGKLFKHILNYVNDFDPKEEDPFVRLAFEPIKQALKRDLKEWKRERKNRSEAGRKGGLKTQAKLKQSKAVLESAKANQAVSVNVSDSVSVNASVINNKYIYPDENYNLDLPENKINSTIEYLTMTKHIKADRNLVNSLWTVFKQKNFTGENPYKSESKIFTHFLETLKFEKINGTHKQSFTSNSPKPGTPDLQNTAVEEF